MRVPPGEQRFVVRELEGYPIRLGTQAKLWAKSTPLLSLSVLDRAYNFAEVARFNEEEGGRARTKEQTQAALRARAAGVAAILNTGGTLGHGRCYFDDTPRCGTHSGYVGGCRCDDCRTAHADYRRALRRVKPTWRSK